MSTLVSLICCVCNRDYKFPLNFFNLRKKRAPGAKDYCSQECFHKAQYKHQLVDCENCGTQFQKSKSQIKKTKHNFCSKSCGAIYRNKNKITGSRRSKLEVYLEDNLVINYPNLDFQFNHVSNLKMELDIYIPSIKMAFEFNGVFHYKPIFGQKKFLSTQANDKRKIEECENLGVQLFVFDVSSEKNFNQSIGSKYLGKLSSIIDEKLSM